jgi:proteasome assembly chaperone (PAC2) family protein
MQTIKINQCTILDVFIYVLKIKIKKENKERRRKKIKKIKKKKKKKKKIFKKTMFLNFHFQPK